MRILPIIALIVMLTACAAPTPEPCHIQAQDYIALTEQVQRDWMNAQIGAGSVFILESVGGRASQDLLTSHLANLQKVRQEIASAAVPQCAQAAQAARLAYMDASIGAYQIYVNGGSLDDMARTNDNVDQLLAVASQKLAELKAN